MCNVSLGGAVRWDANTRIVVKPYEEGVSDLEKAAGLDQCTGRFLSFGGGILSGCHQNDCIADNVRTSSTVCGRSDPCYDSSRSESGVTDCPAGYEVNDGVFSCFHDAARFTMLWLLFCVCEW